MALFSGKKTRRPRPDPKSTLLQMVLKEVVTLPLWRQDSIAIEILDSLAEADPKSARFQQLIENKYTAGLSAEECTELEGLEGDFRKDDEAFYGPILERIKGSGTLVMQFSEEMSPVVPSLPPVASDAVRQEIHRLREQAKVKFAEQYAKAQSPAAK